MRGIIVLVFMLVEPADTATKIGRSRESAIARAGAAIAWTRGAGLGPVADVVATDRRAIRWTGAIVLSTRTTPITADIRSSGAVRRTGTFVFCSVAKSIGTGRRTISRTVAPVFWAVADPISAAGGVVDERPDFV